MNQSFPRSITINLFYDKNLQKITKKVSEKVVVSEGLPFILFLSFIFKSYPQIEKIYSPGTLGFVVNGKPPSDFDIMQNGDKVKFNTFRALIMN